MAHTLVTKKKNGEIWIASLVMDYKNKLDTVLNNKNSELLDLKNKFTKLEPDIEIGINVNNKLVDQITRLEQKC